MSRQTVTTADLSINPHSSSSTKSSTKSPRSPASPYDPLTSALAAVQARYTIANSQSLKAHNEACHDFPGGNTRTTLYASPFPLTFVKGKGAELTTLDGDVLVDFLGEYTAGIYGHSNEVIAAAVTEALTQGWNYGGPNLYERELARKVTTRFSPSGIELVRFTNSGTESNTMAIAAAKAFTGRKKILAFKNAYHGGTLSFPPTISPTNVNLPHDFIYAPYNDIAGTESIISLLPKDSLAAIIVEPIQGSGGCIVGTEEFLQFLNTTAHKLGALFIVDEVMTSRLSYNGYSSSLGLKPDLVTLGKWIGGGMTFGAFGGRRDGGIMSMFDPRKGILSHAGTFNNNVITMAAGCAGIEIYNEDAVKKLNSLGESLKSGLEDILAKHGVQKQSERPSNGITVESLSLEEKSSMWISGKGSMLSVHFSGESGNSLKALFWHHMLDHGIYLAPRGFMGLNMELKKEHVTKFLEAAEKFVVKYQQALLS